MKLILLCLSVFFSLMLKAQVPYGNNPAAGKYYSINGIKLYCEIYGRGKPLLMIHGNGGNISAFAKNIPYFASKYQVIAVDSRAQGKSVDNGDSLSFEMMADDFAALLTELKIPSAYVLGWSDGGINALMLAMRHPEKVTALASTGANLWPDSTAVLPSLWKEELAIATRFKNDKTPLTPIVKNKRKVFLLNWYQPNIPLKALHTIQCPALIIAGDHDLIRTHHTVEIYENIPKAYLWIVPKSGHGTLMEHAAEFNTKVDDFFKSGYSKM